MERRRQMQVETGEAFRPSIFDNFLERWGIQVFEMRFGHATASSWADMLFQRYPTHAEWEAAKKATVGGELKKGFVVEPGWMPMTTDWLVALEVEHDPESFIITADEGEEWRHLRQAVPRRALSLQEALDWLNGLPE